jgi:hypothetical protein
MRAREQHLHGDDSCTFAPCVQVISDALFDFITAFIARRLPWLEGCLFIGVYADLSPNWYRYVGSKPFVTLYVQIAVILMKKGLKALLDRYKRAMAARAKTQPDMRKCASACRRSHVLMFA